MQQAGPVAVTSILRAVLVWVRQRLFCELHPRILSSRLNLLNFFPVVANAVKRQLHVFTVCISTRRH